ncbi:MAG: hypothetical protein IPG92_10850 [Flavobacteriales bacterium]|nr:hypothetical protein [Flavobacteriales bacterium]
MRAIVILVQLFFGISATWCGAALMMAPDGSLLQLPLSVLTHAPFSDFFWPGFVLCTVLGLGHVVAFVLAVRRSSLAAWAALAGGFAAIIWILVQVIMTDPFFWLQPVIGALGLLEVLGGESLLRK